MHIIRGTALPIWKDIRATPEGTALEGFSKLSFDVSGSMTLSAAF